MNTRQNIKNTFSFALLGACFCLGMQAQAQHMWVSGVGDDANPCTRTAPCKTFAGAISKTAANGEMDILDPGSFNAVTITKSMTIDGIGNLGAIQISSGSFGITINAGATDVVTLRNLSLGGNGVGLYGIRVIAAGEVHIENCVIFGCTSHGIDFEPTSVNATLFVKNTHIQNFGGTGIYLKPGNTGSSAIIETTELEQCAVGLHVDTNCTTIVRKSVVSQNTGAGIEVAAGGLVTVEDTDVSLNGFGVNSAGTVTISGATVTGNTGFGLTNSVGGSILTYHNNKIYGNNPDGAPTGSQPLR